MKKKLLLAVFLSMSMFASACGTGGENSDSGSGNNSSGSGNTINSAYKFVDNNEIKAEDVTFEDLLNHAVTPVDQFEYEIINDHCEITGYIGADNIVVVPDEIEGKPVTSVGEAFQFNPENTCGNNVVALKLGKYVEELGYYALVGVGYMGSTFLYGGDMYSPLRFLVVGENFHFAKETENFTMIFNFAGNLECLDLRAVKENPFEYDSYGNSSALTGLSKCGCKVYLPDDITDFENGVINSINNIEVCVTEGSPTALRIEEHNKKVREENAGKDEEKYRPSLITVCTSDNTEVEKNLDFEVNDESLNFVFNGVSFELGKSTWVDVADKLKQTVPMGNYYKDQVIGACYEDFHSTEDDSNRDITLSFMNLLDTDDDKNNYTLVYLNTGSFNKDVKWSIGNLNQDSTEEEIKDAIGHKEEFSNSWDYYSGDYVFDFTFKDGNVKKIVIAKKSCVRVTGEYNYWISALRHRDELGLSDEEMIEKYKE